MNWFLFNNGLHTVHHDNPGLHWSKTRGRSMRLDRMAAERQI